MSEVNSKCSVLSIYFKVWFDANSKITDQFYVLRIWIETKD
jgi:hypothetical protein